MDKEDLEDAFAKLGAAMGYDRESARLLLARFERIAAKEGKTLDSWFSGMLNKEKASLEEQLERMCVERGLPVTESNKKDMHEIFKRMHAEKIEAYAEKGIEGFNAMFESVMNPKKVVRRKRKSGDGK